MKKLCRSSRNKVIAGVCGGFGEYFNIDPNIIRLIWLLFILSGTGIILYIIAAIIIPMDNEIRYKSNPNNASSWYDDEI